MKININILQLPHGADLPLPAYETADAAGMDLRAAIPDAISIAPNMSMMIPTGFAIALPTSAEAQVRPRSGLAARHGVTVLNAPGTIDADYRGEISVILINHGTKPFIVNRGDRIAQLVIAPVIRADWIVVDTLDVTHRGAGGFGSTGL